MSFSDDFIIQLYSQTLDSYDKVYSLLQNNETDISDVLQRLFTCEENINCIIELETKDDNYVPLIHLKSQIKVMVENILKIQKSSLDHVPLTKKVKFDDNYQTKLNAQLNATVEVPKVASLKEIAGLNDLKSILKTLVILPKLQPQLFNHVNICNCILLYGPPGTGKTRLVHALAAEAKAVLYCISASDILSPFSGESEKTIKALFKSIRDKECYSMLFIDEIDGLCTKRTGSEQNHSRRLKTELMCQLTKMEDCRHVFIFGATNCPWDLDTAILRRFKRRFYIPLPNKSERFELLQFFIKNTPLENIQSDNLFEILDITEGYSGSDLSNLVQYAFNIPLIELQNTSVWKITPDGFFEPSLITNFGDGKLDETIFIRKLDDIPPNSVHARPVSFKDILSATNCVPSTVPRDDITKYESFNCFN